MGGGGGGLTSRELEALAKLAQEEIKKAKGEVVKRNVFISFDHDDIGAVDWLRVQAKDPNSNLEFSDRSLQEPANSENEEYIKRVIRERINQASVTLVYLTPNSANSSWVHWEIEQSIKMGKGVVGVYSGDAPPGKLPALFVEKSLKVVKWEQANLTREIDNAARMR